MPRKPKRPCSYPGCPNLADGQHCKEHEAIARRQYNKYERSADVNKKYGRAWKRIRDRYAAAHPLCEMCLKEGRLTPVDEVHHIVPISQGGTHVRDNLMSLSNTALNHIAAGYSNTAVAGMGIAKQIDLLAYAIAQGMTQGTLPLIGYNFSSGNTKRMKQSIKTAFLYSLIVAVCGTILLYFFAAPIAKVFIADEQTVHYGQTFLKIICLACPTTAVNFMVITVFQAVGKKVQPLFLSLLRKGSLDILFMLLLNQTMGISGIAWATPFADWVALVISLVLFVPYIRKLSGVSEEKNKV